MSSNAILRSNRPHPSRLAGRAALLVAAALVAVSAFAEVAMRPDGSELLIESREGAFWAPARPGIPAAELLNPFGDARGDGRPSVSLNPYSGRPELAWGLAGRRPGVVFARWNLELGAWSVRRIAQAAGTSRWAGRVPQLVHDAEGNRHVVFEDAETQQVLLASAPRDSDQFHVPFALTDPTRPGTSPAALWDDGSGTLLVAWLRTDLAGALQIMAVTPQWDAAGRLPTGGEGIPGIPEPIFTYSGRPGSVFGRTMGSGGSPGLSSGASAGAGAAAFESPPVLRMERFPDGRVLVTWIEGQRLVFTVREAGTWAEPDSLELLQSVDHESVRSEVRSLLDGKLTPVAVRSWKERRPAPELTRRR